MNWNETEDNFSISFASIVKFDSITHEQKTNNIEIQQRLLLLLFLGHVQRFGHISVRCTSIFLSSVVYSLDICISSSMHIDDKHLFHVEYTFSNNEIKIDEYLQVEFLFCFSLLAVCEIEIYFFFPDS